VQDVAVQPRGAQGLLCRIKRTVPHAAVVKVTLQTGAQHRIVRHAVVWPGHAAAWMFPRVTGTSASKAAGSIRVVQAEWWSAWSSNNEMLLGTSPELVRRVMESPCARTRWWFAMPRIDPPLIVPPAVAMSATGKLLDVGSAVPLKPFCPAVETVPGTTTVRCAWCKQTKQTRTEWVNTCAPDAAFTLL
jgi:hypothetical protein